MTIYLDLVILINYFFDFLLLETVNITLKRNVSLKRIGLISILGEVSILFFFIKSKILLIVLKLILSVFMNIGCFHYKDIVYTINNLGYFYMSSIILGGVVYFLKLNGINYIVILVSSPFIFYFYYKQNQSLKMEQDKYIQVRIYFTKNVFIDVMGYLDTGNHLKDCITNKPVILLNKNLIPSTIHIRSPMYIPYKVLNHTGLIKCIRGERIEIKDQSMNKFLIGIMESDVGISGIDCILNVEVIEGMKKC